MKRIFISYSHKDAQWKNRLVPHLKVLHHQGHLEAWNDRDINAGNDWNNKIEEALQQADAAILLISADSETFNY